MKESTDAMMMMTMMMTMMTMMYRFVLLTYAMNILDWKPEEIPTTNVITMRRMTVTTMVMTMRKKKRK